MSRKKSLSDLGGLVYSTDQGRTCPDCRNPINDCTCSTEEIPQGDGIVRLRYEKKGRNGKGVTLVDGLPEPTDELKKIAKELKKKCGVGGALKERIIEIQGDQRDLLQRLLEDKGYTVKRAGA